MFLSRGPGRAYFHRQSYHSPRYTNEMSKPWVSQVISYSFSRKILYPSRESMQLFEFKCLMFPFEQGFGSVSGSVLDPYSIGPLDPDP
jgi:hypothetical protein